MWRYPGFIFCFLLLFINHSISAQFSMKEFLNQAKNDVRLSEYEQKSQFLEKNPYKSPWVQRTEFRIRTNDFNISADDYRFRISPTNPFEIRANKQYYQMEFNLLLSEYQKALNSALNERYQLIIDYLELSSRQSFKEKQILIIEDELKLHNAEMNDPGFSLMDYLEAKENLIQAHLEFNELYHQRELINVEIKSKYAFTGEIASEDINLVDIKTLENWLNTIFLDYDTSNTIHAENLQQQNLLTEQRIKLERAEDRRNIGFLQAEFDRERGDEFDDHMGFQIGIRVPLTNPDRPDMNRSRIDLIEDKAETVQRITEINIRTELLRIKLKYLFDQYDLISNNIKDGNFQRIASFIQDIRPEDLLKAQRVVLRLERLENQIKWEIYKSYIDYLYFRGQLIELPLRNYLSADFTEI